MQQKGPQSICNICFLCSEGALRGDWIQVMIFGGLPGLGVPAADIMRHRVWEAS